MDVASAADELYGLPAEDFARRRTELSKQARADGDKQAAAEIGKLRKPVQAAALVNAVVRAEPAAIDRLRELAERLRSAHRQLRGDDLRELSQARQALLSELTELARGHGPGGSATEPVLGQVRATFEAAIADATAEEAALSGRLTAALSYSGFGEVDVTDAVAVPRLRAVPDLAEPKTEPEPEPEPKAENEPSAKERAAAKRAAEAARREYEDRLAAAQAESAEARDVAEHAGQDVEHAGTVADQLAGRIAELRDELAQAESAHTDAVTAARAADKALRAAERAVDRAERAESDVRATAPD